MNSLCNIEKLGDSNYSSWFLQMRSVLIQSDLWGYVTGARVLKSEASAEEKELWKTQDEKALALIILGIKSSELINVKHCQTSKQAWEELYKIHKPRGPARKVMLLNQLIRFKIQMNQDVTEQVMNFYRLIEELNEIQLPVPEELLSVILLNSLPESYEGFTVAIESRDTLPSLDNLKIKILEEERRRNDRESDSNPSAGEKILIAKTQKEKAPRIKGKCYACGKRGHYAANCSTKKQNKRVTTQHLATFCVSAYNLVESLEKTWWCLDSGASAHMCMNKQLFSDFSTSIKQTVTIAAGVQAKVKGIGTVLWNSESGIITLKDVLFVPELKGNFLSVAKIVQHERNGTWELVDPPPGQQIIGCKWVLTTKRDSNGSTDKYKARLVALGCLQRCNVDYFETSAPVARASSIRLVIAAAAEYGLVLHHVDIVSAYLHGDLKEDIYMNQPRGFENVSAPTKVCKLKKSIYGLKQAGKDWNDKLNQILTKIGFKRCKADNCVYVLEDIDGIIIIASYVDDLIIASKDVDTINNVKHLISKEVEITDKGPLEHYLGVRIERAGATGSFFLSQSRFIRDLLQEYNMTECRCVNTPLDPGTVLNKCTTEGCKNQINTTSYQALIGSLNYLAVWSRPDIAHAVSRLAQFNSHPHEEHFKAAKHVLRYLSGTRGFKIRYQKTGKQLECFADADWANDKGDRKSYSGYIVFFAGGPVAWSSKKQTSVALSTAEAEYVAIAEAAKEVLSLRSFLEELQMKEMIGESTPIWNDNQSAQHIIKKAPAQSKRTKHIDIKVHFVKDVYEKGIIELRYIDSGRMIADVLTKLLPKTKHMNCVRLIGLSE